MSKKPYENSNNNSGGQTNGQSNGQSNSQSNGQANGPSGGSDPGDLSQHRLHQEDANSEEVTSIGAKAENSTSDNVQNLKPDLNSVDHWRGEAEKFKNEYLYLRAAE